MKGNNLWVIIWIFDMKNHQKNLNQVDLLSTDYGGLNFMDTYQKFKEGFVKIYFLDNKWTFNIGCYSRMQSRNFWKLKYLSDDQIHWAKITLNGSTFSPRYRNP